ncbi:MAG: squalene synthase HpnC [Azoarcus sp.]|jgi:phytoene synthase|nr:squalene synthase HpnC [Azoarcus sp.]
MPVDHYENFPVASLLLPARLREPVEAIYAFARGADDIADEGDIPPETRLAMLDAWREALRDIEAGRPPGDPALAPLFNRLAQAIERHHLPFAPFHDLLDAFRRDATQTRYVDFIELLNYCRRSANPVGRLLLHLYDAASPANLLRSDAVCTSLQLINFCQDIAIDWKKGRVYLPQDDLARFGLADDMEAGRMPDAESQAWPRWRELMAYEIRRARDLMRSGAPLARQLPGRIGWELRLIVLGGLRILDKIETADYDVFKRRPTLGRLDWLRISWRAVTYPW